MLRLNVNWPLFYTELVSGKRRKIHEQILFQFLVFLSFFYSLIIRVRALAYAIEIFKRYRLPLPVISVGNITMGGTGKTPTVLFLAKELMARGMRVAVLTRGYGGTLEGETRIVGDGSSILLSPEEAGDEPCLLASSLPGLMVVMGSDRYKAGLLAIKDLSPDIFILDDGFQHQRVERDLDIVLLDSTAPFGNGRTVPAGFLREPQSSLNRASLVIFTRADGLKAPTDLLPAAVPYCVSSHRLSGFSRLGNDQLLPFQQLTDRRIVAFCGIAAPDAFFDGLEVEGVKLVSTLAFPDHSEYGVREMEALGRLKVQSKADCFITTAKDAVKLTRYAKIIGECYVDRLELELHDPEPLITALDRIVL